MPFLYFEGGDWDNKRRHLTIGTRHGSFPGILAKRTFKIVVVGKTHGVGDGETREPDKVVTYTGQKTAVKF